jgi:hypothetical protein
MRLDELHIESRHDGKRLIVRAVTPPYKGSGTVIIVEDEFGNGDKLGIYNQSESSILYSVSEGSILAIKEPYYKYCGENDNMISVDHPSDIILLEADDPLVPKAFDAQPVKKSPLEWRQAGDMAFIGKNLPLAVSW